jgi:hypothetical protein
MSLGHIVVVVEVALLRRSLSLEFESKGLHVALEAIVNAQTVTSHMERVNEVQAIWATQEGVKVLR